MKLKDYFIKDLKPRQRQYEALRAVAFDQGSIEKISAHFGYSPQSLKTLISRLLTGKHHLFPDVKTGPKTRHTLEKTVELITRLRKEKRLSSTEISQELKEDGISVSIRTVERILKDAGFLKLCRRTDRQRGVNKKGVVIAGRSSDLDFKKLKPFRAQCQVAGIYLFLPYIIESGILDIVGACSMPQSSDIGKVQASLAMLLLKLIGNERLSNINNYDSDLGFGIFAGLNVLPKPSYICSYSCRTDAARLMEFQKKIIEKLLNTYPYLYEGDTINLDFHSIPHFGSESEMENVWCGVRGKVLKGANTFFAQDGASNALMYVNADIKREESSLEIKKFLNWWLDFKGVMGTTLVFDSKLTRYDILYAIDKAGINFITLRRKGKNIIDKAGKLPEKNWKKYYLPIPKRKHRHVKVYEDKTILVDKQKPLRQIIIKDHGRAEPTFIITNNFDMNILDILVIYAKRWHIENKLSELVDFFNMNSLSSPIMIRIHFDLLYTVIADTIYHLFAKDLKRFEKCRAKTIFKRFINMPGQIEYDGNKFTVKIRKRATTPLLLGVEKLNKEIKVPWLANKPLQIIWTA
jgi:transposase